MNDWPPKIHFQTLGRRNLPTPEFIRVQEGLIRPLRATSRPTDNLKVRSAMTPLVELKEARRLFGLHKHLKAFRT
jgi:hypothetical protein